MFLISTVKIKRKKLEENIPKGRINLQYGRLSSHPEAYQLKVEPATFSHSEKPWPTDRLDDLRSSVETQRKESNYGQC
jgi:hypothetical protein